MRLPIFSLFYLLLISCNIQSPATTNLSEKSPTEVPSISKNEYPKEMPPVYERFDDLAYIFQQQTDTTYIINFWATWCKPCVEELPYFEQLTQQYKDQKLKVILVSLDFEKQLTTKLIPYLKKHKIQSEVLVLLDPNDNVWLEKVDPSWSGAIPVTLVYKNKERAFYEESFEDYAALEKVVKAIDPLLVRGEGLNSSKNK